MKNPLLDAIKNMKAKRIAVIVGDAEEMGLGDANGVVPVEAQAESMDAGMEAEEGEGLPVEAGADAETVMGRKPFSGKKPVEAAPEDGEMSDEVAEELYDEQVVNRMGDRRPKSLMERAQLKLKEKLGR